MLLWLWHTGELQHEQPHGVLYMMSLLLSPCCLLSQYILLLFLSQETSAFVLVLHASLATMHLFILNISPLHFAVSMLNTVADARPHYTDEVCSCASQQYLLCTHRTLTNRLCGAMQLLWILGPIALLIATTATLLCFFWMDFLPTPSRAQLHLLKSHDEHE